jgi:hypothetical protein
MEGVFACPRFEDQADRLRVDGGQSTEVTWAVLFREAGNAECARVGCTLGSGT